MTDEIKHLVNLPRTMLLHSLVRHKNIISKFDEFMCNNWTPENVHSLWNELLTRDEEEWNLEGLE